MKIRILSLSLGLFLGVATHAQEFYSLVDTTIENLSELPQVNNWLEDFDPYNYTESYQPNFKKTRIPYQQAWQYPHLREADVSFARRYHRIIDCRQKMNRSLLHPKNSLPKLFLSMALSGDIPMYQNYDFKEQMSREQMKTRMTYVVSVDIFDTVTMSAKTMQIREPIPFEELHKFRIMEEHVFDNTHSVMKPRIVGIALMYAPRVAEGAVILNEQPIAWMKYEDIRGHLINNEVFNRKNEAAQISFDHFFQARMFDSYIVKEPNMDDVDIKYYPELEDDGLGQLLKSEEVKNDLFVTEHDLWEY